ncbi:MAG: trigger factor, partial [Terrabacter sp.]|nr:trigger factor [Terrabacter sp.]
MKSALETLSPTRVKMTVEVPFEELKPSLDAAIKHIGEHIQVPGFRKGKVPARIIEQRVGRAAVLEEAVNNALPTFYGQALEENSVRPLGQPEITDLKVPASDGEDFTFTAEVDKRPEIDLPDFSDIELTVDEAKVEDEAVEQRLTDLRARFGTLKGVDRAVQDGDFVSIDLSAEIDGEQIDSVTDRKSV